MAFLLLGCSQTTKRVKPMISKPVESSHAFINVFNESMIVNGNSMELIEHLDAFQWEKEALVRMYSEHTDLWNIEQKEEFKVILEKDKYLSLCGDKRYYENLLFSNEDARVDILYSILFLRYVNNLSNGCVQWVSSHVKDENHLYNIQADYLLSMIEKDALVERLLIPFIPKKRAFTIALRDYHLMVAKSENSESVIRQRLEVESLKAFESYPTYK